MMIEFYGCPKECKCLTCQDNFVEIIKGKCHHCLMCDGVTQKIEECEKWKERK